LFSRLRQLPRTHPRLGLLLRVSAWAATLGYFAFALLLLALRYAILPQIESYRGDIEQMIGTAINRPVGIRRIETHWAGLRPALTLEGFEIRDASGRPALGFDEVEAELSWSSLWHFQLRLARLELNAPILSLRRDREGRIFAAGLEITPDPATDEEFADWLLVQDSVIVRDAAITWQDDLRRAPPLELKHLNFQLDNSFGRHRFGLTADPPRQLAARIDIRGNFKGRDFDQLEAWKGEAYAELDYADLAVWRALGRLSRQSAAGQRGTDGSGLDLPASSCRPRPPTCAWPMCACNCAATCRSWTWSGWKAASPGVASMAGFRCRAEAPDPGDARRRRPGPARPEAGLAGRRGRPAGPGPRQRQRTRPRQHGEPRGASAASTTPPATVWPGMRRAVASMT
jgi:hypothetical protein